MGNNPLEIATYLFEFTCEFREILNNQCRIISANSVREFTFDDWHVNWPLNICSSHFCPAFLAMVRRQFHRSLFFFKCSQNMSDFNFNLAHRSSIHKYSTCSSSEFVTPKYTTNWGQSKSDYLFVKEFNLLSNTVKFSKSVSGFIREYFSQS